MLLALPYSLVVLCPSLCISLGRDSHPQVLIVARIAENRIPPQILHLRANRTALGIPKSRTSTKRTNTPRRSRNTKEQKGDIWHGGCLGGKGGNFNVIVCPKTGAIL
jgi:hypothetical protein